MLSAWEYRVCEVRQAAGADEEGEKEETGEGKGGARGRGGVFGHSVGTPFLVQSLGVPRRDAAWR